MAVIQPFFNPQQNPNIPIFATFLNGFIERRTATNMMLLQRYLEGADTQYLSDQIKELEISKRKYVELEAKIRKSNAKNRTAITKQLVSAKTRLAEKRISFQQAGTLQHLELLQKGLTARSGSVSGKQEVLKEFGRELEETKLETEKVKTKVLSPLMKAPYTGDAKGQDWGSVYGASLEGLATAQRIDAKTVGKKHLYIAKTIATAFEDELGLRFAQESPTVILMMAKHAKFSPEAMAALEKHLGDKEDRTGVHEKKEGVRSDELTRISRLFRDRAKEVLVTEPAAEVLEAQEAAVKKRAKEFPQPMSYEAALQQEEGRKEEGRKAAKDVAEKDKNWKEIHSPGKSGNLMRMLTNEAIEGEQEGLDERPFIKGLTEALGKGEGEFYKTGVGLALKTAMPAEEIRRKYSNLMKDQASWAQEGSGKLPRGETISVHKMRQLLLGLETSPVVYVPGIDIDNYRKAMADAIVASEEISWDKVKAIGVNLEEGEDKQGEYRENELVAPSADAGFEAEQSQATVSLRQSKKKYGLAVKAYRTAKAKTKAMKLGFETDVEDPLKTREMQRAVRRTGASTRALRGRIAQTQSRIDRLSRQRFELQQEHAKRGKEAGYFGPFKRNYLLDNPFVVKSSGERLMDQYLTHFNIQRTIPKGGPTVSTIYKNISMGHTYELKSPKLGSFRGGITKDNMPYVEQETGRRKVYKKTDDPYKELMKTIKKFNKQLGIK